ncbi:MAG TPA: plastocyanin/azurin family copper-binding protein [Candidatus Binataceae bacterium]|jgi:plastocyanin|nr:plastocyanin/azurin family copper-binding protein [Candidatus Binataceae bacterium]
MRELTVRTAFRRVGATLAALIFVAGAVPSIAAAKTVEVKMTDTPPKFVPLTVTIDKGDTVEWINNAVSLHSVTTNPAVAQDPKDVSSPAGAKPFDSGFMTPGVKWSYTFTVPGTYKYLCLPHEKDHMVGIVVVK